MVGCGAPMPDTSGMGEMTLAEFRMIPHLGDRRLKPESAEVHGEDWGKCRLYEKESVRNNRKDVHCMHAFIHSHGPIF